MGISWLIWYFTSSSSSSFALGGRIMIMFPDRSTLSGGTDMKSDFPGKLKSGSLKKFGMEFRRPLPILALSPFSGRFFSDVKNMRK